MIFSIDVEVWQRFSGSALQRFSGSALQIDALSCPRAWPHRWPHGCPTLDGSHWEPSVFKIGAGGAGKTRFDFGVELRRRAQFKIAVQAARAGH